MKGRLLVASTHAGVGKTTVILNLQKFFQEVQHLPLGLLPQREPILDSWLFPPAVLRQRLAALEHPAFFLEGPQGLFDGAMLRNDWGSPMEVAKLLDAPVFLVINGANMGRSAAALVNGFTRFEPDPRTKWGGIFINHVQNEGHFHFLKEAIEEETGIPVIGGILQHEPTRFLWLDEEKIQKALIPRAIEVTNEPPLCQSTILGFFGPEANDNIQYVQKLGVATYPLQLEEPLPDHVATLYLYGTAPHHVLVPLVQNALRRNRKVLIEGDAYFSWQQTAIPNPKTSYALLHLPVDSPLGPKDTYIHAYLQNELKIVAGNIIGLNRDTSPLSPLGEVTTLLLATPASIPWQQNPSLLQHLLQPNVDS